MAGKDLKCIYVLRGDEPALVDHHRAQIISQALGDADSQTSLMKFESDADLADVLDGLRTLPFLAPRRVVVVRGADAFVTRHREALEKYFKNPSRNAVLILQVTRWNKTWRIHKNMSTRGELIDCSTPAAGDLRKVIRAAAQQRGKKIRNDAVEALIEFVGADQAAILNYVEQLSLYADERDTITADDVGALVAPTAGPAAFALTNAIAAGDAAAALRQLNKMISTRGDEFRALGAVHWHLRNAYSAARRLQNGRPSDVSMPAAPKRDFMKMLNRRSVSDFRRDLRRLAATDLAMKSGRDPVAAMRELIINLCSSQK